MMNAVSLDIVSSNPPQTPKVSNMQTMLDEVDKLGYFYIPFMFYQQLMILILAASFLFSTFGSQLPVISKCDEVNFEILPSSYRYMCRYLEGLHASGYNCTPVFDNDFWSLPQELNYYCDTAYIVKQATTIQMIGYFFGAVIAGQLSDMFGRKKVLIAGIIGMLVSFVGVSFTAELVWYSVAMFFMAVFSSYLITVDTVYIVEMVPQKYVVWSLMFIGFSPNIIVFAGLAWISHDFRTLARVCAGITAALLVMQIWCPESARWLLQKRRLEEAKNVVKRIHKWNRTLTEKKSIELDLAFSKEGHDVARREEIKNEINPNSRKNFYLHHLFLTSTMTRQMVTLCFLYTVFYIGYYLLLLNTEHFPGNIFVNVAVMGASLWLINILYGILDVKNGRLDKNDNIYLFVLIVTMFCLIFVLLTGSQIVVIDVTCCTILGTLSFNCLIIAGVFAAEVFPTPVRNSAVGLIHFCGGIGMFLAVLLKFDLPLQEEGVGTYLLMSCFVGILIPLVKCLPETRGVPLNDKMPDESEWMWGKRN